MKIVTKANNMVDEMTPEELDLHVDYIRAVYKSKREMAAAKIRAQLKVGTRVRLSGNRKPQYLIGLAGTIEEMRQTRVTIKLDCGPVGKFRSGRVITGTGGLDILEG